MKVLDYIREQEPRFNDVPDAELTKYIGETNPEFLQDPEFNKKFQSLTKGKSNAIHAKAAPFIRHLRQKSRQGKREVPATGSRPKDDEGGSQTPKAQEVIVAAAYRDESGKVHTGANHPEILKRLGIKGFESRESRNTPQFGFTTTQRPFITREVAGPVAEKSGQAMDEFDSGEQVHSDQVSSPQDSSTPLSET